MSRLKRSAFASCGKDRQQTVFRSWSCPAYVPVFQLIYAAFRSNAKGLLLFSDEWRRREL